MNINEPSAEELQSDGSLTTAQRRFPVQSSATVSTQKSPVLPSLHPPLHAFFTPFFPELICKPELLLCLPDWPAAIII